MADNSLFPDLNSGSAALSNGGPTSNAAPEAMPDLFGQAANGGLNTGNSTVVDSVMAKGDTAKILGPKPKSASDLGLGSETFHWGSLLFKFGLIALVSTYGFFFTQLSLGFTWLGQNPIQRLSVFQESFKQEQTDINFYNSLIAKFALDDFSLQADSYLFKYAEYESEYTSENSRAQLKKELDQLQSEIQISLTTIKEKLIHPLYPKALAFKEDTTKLENEYLAALKSKIAEDQKKLTTQKDSESQFQSHNLNSILALLNAKEFQQNIKSLDLSQELDFKTIETLFTMATGISKNEFTTVLTIKGSRVHWSTVLQELEELTQKVDPLYGSGIKGNIFYTNLTFNSSDQTIALKGTTQTEDTLNFSLISDLMDALEQSTLFANVSDRSFSKNSEQGDSFTSSFSIELQLQTGEDLRDEVIPTVLSTPAPTNSRTTSPETTGPPADTSDETSQAPESEEIPLSTETSSVSLTDSVSTNFLNVFDSISSLWAEPEKEDYNGHIPRA
ncbi:MAG: hypothetical protein UW70_C0068G0015 [Candidatus Peregrinibacteria bacterium GW2011_GWA2_44_7]|nr:MAG: hypothetical protein UW70_C0068G0015 [Candidatus Peregrinibacteria bacterium GW2011_GWA2_44_7]